MSGGSALDPVAFGRWRQGQLRNDLASVLRGYQQQPPPRRRRKLILAGQTELEPGKQELVAAVNEHQRKGTRHWSRVKLQLQGRRLVVDRLATAAEIRAVVAGVQQTSWYSSSRQHGGGFATVSLSSFTEQPPSTPDKRQQWQRSRRILHRLRERARACICEAFATPVLFNCHSALAVTAGPNMPVQKTYSDEEAGALFEALQLKDAGNKRYRAGMFEDAIERYSAALAVLATPYRDAGSDTAELRPLDTHPETANILNNRAACHSQLKAHRQVIADTSSVMALAMEAEAQYQPVARRASKPSPLNAALMKAMLRRGYAYEAIEKYEPALDDMQQVMLAQAATPGQRRDAVRAAGRLRGLLRQWREIQAREQQGLDYSAAGRDGSHSQQLRDTVVPHSQQQWKQQRQEKRGLHEQQNQFGEVHCDMASVIDYDFSAVLYLNTGGGVDFSGGDLIFCDYGHTDGGRQKDLPRSDAEVELVERRVVPRAGRLCGFSSGLENIHRISEVAAGKAPRLVFTMWFTKDVSRREDDSDLGWRYQRAGGGLKRVRSSRARL